MDKLKATTVAAGIIGLTVIPSFAGPAPMPSEPFPIDMPAACSGLRGSLGVTLGNTWLDGNSGTISAGEEDEFLSAMMELRLGMDLNDQWYGQLDLLGEVTDVGQSPDSYRDGWGGGFARHVPDGSIWSGSVCGLVSN